MGFGGGTGNEGNRSTASSVSIGSDLKIYKTPKQQVLERDFSIGSSLFIQQKSIQNKEKRKEKQRTSRREYTGSCRRGLVSSLAGVKGGFFFCCSLFAWLSPPLLPFIYLSFSLSVHPSHSLGK